VHHASCAMCTRIFLIHIKSLRHIAIHSIACNHHTQTQTETYIHTQRNDSYYSTHNHSSRITNNCIVSPLTLFYALQTITYARCATPSLTLVHAAQLTQVQSPSLFLYLLVSLPSSRLSRLSGLICHLSTVATLATARSTHTAGLALIALWHLGAVTVAVIHNAAKGAADLDVGIVAWVATAAVLAITAG
jgi:hypothetical protein